MSWECPVWQWSEAPPVCVRVWQHGSQWSVKSVDATVDWTLSPLALESCTGMCLVFFGLFPTEDIMPITWVSDQVNMSTMYLDQWPPRGVSLGKGACGRAPLAYQGKKRLLWVWKRRDCTQAREKCLERKYKCSIQVYTKKYLNTKNTRLLLGKMKHAMTSGRWLTSLVTPTVSIWWGSIISSTHYYIKSGSLCTRNFNVFMSTFSYSTLLYNRSYFLPNTLHRYSRLRNVYPLTLSNPRNVLLNAGVMIITTTQ